MQSNPYAQANAALAELNVGLAELLAEFDADRKARRKPCPPVGTPVRPSGLTTPGLSRPRVGTPLFLVVSP